MLKYLFIPLLILAYSSIGYSQEAITFFTQDSVKIYAYDYKVNDTLPYVIMLHDEGGNKLDYDDIPYKIAKLGYNCLTIDMRIGNNETSAEYIKKHPEGVLDNTEAIKDIKAAINYIYNKNQKKVVLFGTGMSASLAMLVAKDDNRVKAVVAFSPGEYFQDKFKVEDKLAGYSTKTFVASSQDEYPYIEQLMSKADKKAIKLFKPGRANGAHGLNALNKKYDGYKEYWLNLYLFFKRL